MDVIHEPGSIPTETIFQRPNGTWGWYDEAWKDGDGVEYIDAKEATKTQRIYHRSLIVWKAALEAAATDPELADAYPRINLKFDDLERREQEIVLQKFKTWYENQDF